MLQMQPTLFQFMPCQLQQDPILVTTFQTGVISLNISSMLVGNHKRMKKSMWASCSWTMHCLYVDIKSHVQGFIYQQGRCVSSSGWLKTLFLMRAWYFMIRCIRTSDCKIRSWRPGPCCSKGAQHCSLDNLIAFCQHSSNGQHLSCIQAFEQLGPCPVILLFP